ncbi:MAG: fibronectin type III domain-containing protein [Bacteroidales bacterium]|nr:fibronectin type III domain-containing protein [Bacteroidales bacterium]
MYSKFFTRLFLLIGMIGQFSVPLRADEIQIGTGNSTDYNLPTHSNYDYSLTQQIYTAEEIETAGGGDGTINSISFYNAGSEKTRTLDVYLANTDKASFANSSDWIAITSSNLVYSGSVTFTAGTWTTIMFTTPFAYDGSNLAVIVDDNTGGYSSGLSCRTFTASSTQSIYSRRDTNNINPSNPINGTPVTTKNQIKLDIEFASETCAKPKNFNATNITAHTATLTWTAGAESQSNWEVFVTTDATVVPDENTSPTYHVTTCSKALTNLAAQTTYYAYVRSACGGSDGNSKWAKKVFTTTREALAVNASHPYEQDFETTNDWGFTNGDLTNKWCWGSATNNGGSKAMYISNDNGTSNAYTLSSTTVVYASKLFAFEQGTYTFVFDWKANGESNSTGTTHYDYMRVALVPGDMDFTAGTTLPKDLNATSLPSSWIALDGGHQLNKSSEWQAQTAEATVSGTYTMVFVWRNDNGSGENPPAAIDNISISFMTCPRPTGLTASNIGGRTTTLNWTENGSATNWVLQYTTDASFTEDLTETNVSGTPTKGLTGLMPETTYYARVKSVLGNDESSWSDVQTFTTTATCPKPSLSYVSNSNTAHTGTVSWTGDADNYELIYSTATSFNPGDEGVTQINLGNVNTYTLQDLTPETTYRVKVRANCGAEDGYGQWSNQVSFTTLATCVAPSGLSATKTATTITLSWTANATGQDAWDIRYKKSTDSDYTYIHLDNHVSTSHTIEGLSPVTTYSVNVRAYCSDTDQSKWGHSAYNQNSDLSVTTECGALTLPYTIDFENVTTSSSSYPMPQCWTRKEYQGGYYGSYTYYPSVRAASYSYPYAHGGNGESATSGNSMHFYKPYTSTDEAAILPEIDEQYAMADVQVSFWARLESYQTNKDLSIGVMTNSADITTFEEVATVTVKDATFQEYTAFLENYTGEGRYIAIRFNSSTSGYIFVDDLTVDVAPSCRIPKDLDAETTDLSATLTWTAGLNETAWNVQYKKASDSEWSASIPVTETTCTLNNLKRATLYEARVQANCSADDQSDWAEMSFTTDCGIWPIDGANALLETFETIDASDFPPICWEKFSHEMTGYSYWYLNSNNGLGSNAAYSSWNEGYAFLVMPQMHIDGDATLSFDYLITTGDYDESCSVVVSTSGMTFSDFNETIWAADGNNLFSGKTSCTVSLSDYDGQDIYIAFKFKGLGTSGCTWYVDNIEVYVTVNQTVELSQGWNWWSPIVEVSLEELEAALGGNGITIKSQTESVNYEDEEWLGDPITLVPGQMYKIQVSTDCSFVFSGHAPSSVSVTIEQGYNWFGFAGTNAMTIEEAFNGFQPAEGDMIKSLDESSTFEDGEWLGGITHLQPGRGYIYTSQDSKSKTLTFSAN